MPCGGFKKLSLNDDIVPDSCFIFSCRFDIPGIIIALGTWTLEFVVLIYFYQISQEDHPQTASITYVPECEDNSSRRLEADNMSSTFASDDNVSSFSPICKDDFTVGTQSIVCGFIILVLAIAPDFFGGLHLAVRRRSVMQIITGIAMMALAIMGLVSASAFVIATAKEDKDVYSNCISILFVLACDEQMYYVIKMLFPAYVAASVEALAEGEDSSAIGLVNNVKFDEFVGRKKTTTVTEMTTGTQQVESPHRDSFA